MKITQRSFVLVFAVATAALLGACTSSAAPAPSPTVTVTSTAALAPSPTVSVTSTPTTAAPVATVTVTKTAKPSSKAGYDAALAEWKAGALADSADQGKNWSKAVTDLTNGQNTDSDTTGYAAAIQHLKQLISLPDAQQSPTENAAYHADINALNTFFHTPGLYS